jgi:hypothetical protein
MGLDAGLTCVVSLSVCVCVCLCLCVCVCSGYQAGTFAYRNTVHALRDIATREGGFRGAPPPSPPHTYTHTRTHTDRVAARTY